MKRTLTLLSLCTLVLTSCESPFADYKHLEDISGVEINDNNGGKEYISYRGAALPKEEIGGYYEMIDVLELIAKQKGEIDDAQFEQLLKERLFKCTDRFMMDTDDYAIEEYGTEYYWTWAFGWDGGPVLGTIMCTEDGLYYEISEPGCASVGDHAIEYMHKQGYHGWYTTNKWSYDAETNTLKTTTGQDLNKEFNLEAEVLYFDGKKAVLLGHVGGVAWYGWRASDPEVRLSFKEELYLFEFAEGRETFLEGYLPKDEYNAMIEAYETRYEEYEGAKMPEKGAGYEEMMEVLNMVDSFNGGADDYWIEKFIKEKLIPVHTMYTQRTNDAGELQWQKRDFDYIRTIMCNDAGDGYISYNTRYEEGDMEAWMQEQGYYGWYENLSWSYDTRTNTLTTTMGELTCKAEIVYSTNWDIVLKGHVAGISETTTDESGKVVPVSDVELIPFRFANSITLGRDETLGETISLTRETFLSGYYTYDAYWAKAEEFGK